MVGSHITLGEGNAAIASLHLDAVIGNAQTDGEAKGFSQPIGGCAGVGINEHRYDNAGRHRPVESHLPTLSFACRAVKRGRKLCSLN